MTRQTQAIINRFAETVRQSSSYEEFYLECMADDEMSALLDRLSACYLAPGGRVAGRISPHELYKSLKSLTEDVDGYKGA